MRKIIFQNMVTLDGFFEGPHQEIDWHMVDEDFNNESLKINESADTLLFGRITYELMANYWPTEEGLRDDPRIARMMNSFQKVVFSRTLDTVDWNNSRLVKGDAAQEAARLKQLPGKDIVIFGSADLAVDLIDHDLIDEFRIFINPVVLGDGHPLFKDIKKPLKLRLVNTRVFKNGLVLLVYHPDRG
jgi:dihydrofolate reductase